jgi:hypothetical protein
MTHVLKQGRFIHVIQLAARRTQGACEREGGQKQDLFLEQLILFPRKRLEPAIHLFQARLNFILVGLFRHNDSHRVLGSSHPDPLVKVYSVDLFPE